MDKQDKKTDSPSPPKKTVTTVRRSKSEIKTKSKYQNQNQAESSSSRSEIYNWVVRITGQASPKRTSSLEKKNKDKKQQKIVPDAGPINSEIASEKDEDDPLAEKSFLLTEAHADEYYMKHPRRGKAIIFNHEHFDKEERREGTHADVEKLKLTLKELKFEIDVCNDFEYTEVKDKIKNLCREDFTDCDCIAFFIMTHGNNKQEIAAKDVYYSFDKVWEPFCADKCPTLAGKPKLYFISACRGKKKDSGKKIFSRGTIQSDSGNTRTFGYRIPNNADFLMAYSTAEGFYSYRDITEGTWFIKSLCDMLMEHHTTKDLLKILTLTSRDVALNNNSKADADKPENVGLVQIPSITSMLIRDLYFRK